MFRKPFVSKSFVQLKGTEKKKLRDKLRSIFSLDPTSSSALALDELLKPKSNVNFGKLVNFNNEKLLVYYLDKCPIAFTTDADGEFICPTVELMWKIPDLMFTFLIDNTEVLSRLQNGADLMLPGVRSFRRQAPTVQDLGNLPRGTPVAISMIQYKPDFSDWTVQGPLLVGQTLMSSEEMIASGMRGRGIKILQVYQDTLWDSGPRHLPPTVGIEKFLDYFPSLIPSEILAAAELNEMSLEQSSSGAAESNESEIDRSTGDSASAAPTEPPIEDKEDSSDDEPAVSPEEQIKFWFFLCLKRKVLSKSELPITTSDFFSLKLKSVVPPNKKLDIKHTKWKKVGNFMKDMVAAGYIKTKEKTKGVEMIEEVNWSHPDITKLEIPEEDEEVEEPSSGDLACVEYSPPVIQEVLSVTAAVMPIFKSVNPNLAKNAELQPSEIREIVTEYVKKNELQRGKFVVLDPHLSDLVKSREETIQWPELIEKVHGRMSKCYRMTWANGKSVLRKNKMPSIELKVERRGGNKKVTLIDNLSVFGIREAEFATKLQKAVAGSTSVHEAANPHEGMQVFVQGNQLAYLERVLPGEYGIPKKFILCCDLAPKKNK